MRLLIIADGRSRNTIGWIDTLLKIPNLSIHLISSYPADKIQGLESQHTVPVAFGGMGRLKRTIDKNSKPEKTSLAQGVLRSVAKLRNPLMNLRYLLGPLTIPKAANEVKKIIREINPDIIHGLRIPYEGMLASASSTSIPLVVSIWGNDLSLHAKGSFLMRRWTKKVLNNCDALIADASRDINLAKKWGLEETKPSFVVPGGGGIPINEIPDKVSDLSEFLGEKIDSQRPIIINPRGFRPGSVRNDTFFKAIPKVIAQFPDALFLCPPMAGEPKAEAWVKELGIELNVRLLPLIPHHEMWDLFRRADITTSISEHDGTPNSLLEAMACGSYPIAGDIESIREWIVDGDNGRLVDPADPEAVASAIIDVLEDRKIREKAAVKNLDIIQDRASKTMVAEEMNSFYQKLLK